MKRVVTVLLACMFVTLLLARPGAAEAVKPLKEWKGTLKDEALRKEAPTQVASHIGYLTDAKAWEKLWKAWRDKEELPKVDFAKELVLVVTVSGPNQAIVGIGLDGEGDLTLGVGSTKVGGPGFGYYLAVVPRKGVKTIDGKPIKD